MHPDSGKRNEAWKKGSLNILAVNEQDYIKKSEVKYRKMKEITLYGMITKMPEDVYET